MSNETELESLRAEIAAQRLEIVRLRAELSRAEQRQARAVRAAVADAHRLKIAADKRLAGNVRQRERLALLSDLLADGKGGWTVPALHSEINARGMRCSERTLQRDLAELSKAGIWQPEPRGSKS